MRTQLVWAFALALLLAGLLSCGGGGGGSSGRAGDGTDSGSTADVSITWRQSAAGVAGYVVHWGTASREYSHEVDVANPSADADGIVRAVLSLPIEDSSATYYFALSSYDGIGAMSAYSNELSIEVSALE
jgi:hypothetical protein